MNPVKPLVAAALFLAGCGNSTLQLDDVPEAELFSRTEHALQGRIEKHFGKDARIDTVLPQGNLVMVGVATRPAPVDGDDIPPVGYVTWDPKSDAMDVVAKETTFREARVVAEGKVALVSDEGELTLKDGEASKLVATGVRGDVAFTEDLSKAALTLRGQSLHDPETKVALVTAAGEVKVLADGEGVDDRPAISPDGKTVVFVSGRTGIASFYRTDVDGAEPVQLTNIGLEPGGEVEGPPAGFIPPPVNADRLEWVDADTLRYDAGGGELWTLNVRTGEAARVGGAE